MLVPGSGYALGPAHRLGTMMSQTPQEAALWWMRRILIDSDFAAAWPRTDPDFRLWLAQVWVWVNQPKLRDVNHEAVAIALAESEPTHPLWEPFAAIQLAELRDVIAVVDLERWQVSDISRPTTPDYEFVHFATGAIEPGQIAPVVVVLLHRMEESWFVANIGDTMPPEPSWPPRPREWKPIVEL
jgi:hypothetical protein